MAKQETKKTKRLDNVILKNKVTGNIFHLSKEEVKRILSSRDGDDYEVLECDEKITKPEKITEKTVKDLVVDNKDLQVDNKDLQVDNKDLGA